MTSTPGDDNEVLTIVPEAEHISAIRLRDEARVGSHTHRSPRKLPRIYTGLFLLGFCWTFLQLALGIHSVEFSSGFETVSVAKRIAATGEFADPFMTPTGPTAHVAPVYPFVMGIAYRYFNLLGAGLLMTTLNAALLGLEMCLVAVLSLRTFGSIRPGVFGAVLLGAGTRLVPQHDALFSAVLLLAAGMALLWNNSARAGIWAGLSVLTVPSFDDLMSGKVTMSQVRDIELDDLLGRDPVTLDTAGLKQWIQIGRAHV